MDTMTLTKTKSEAVTIFQTVHNDNIYLQFDFIGHLNEESALQAIDRWKTEMNKPRVNGAKMNLIYNCTRMTGFDTNARRNWQAAMQSLKQQIGTIWLVSDNFFILSAAKTMGVLTGFSIKVTRSLKEIKD